MKTTPVNTEKGEGSKQTKHRDRSRSESQRTVVLEQTQGRGSGGDSSDDDDHDKDKDHRHQRVPRKEVYKTQRHRRSRLPSSSSDSDGASEYVTGNRRRHIRPRTYDGTTSFETFWAHFECCSEYNRWRSSDKLAHLKAALVRDAGRVLWDSDPKDI